MQNEKGSGSYFRSKSKAVTVFKIVVPVLLVFLLFASMVTPLRAQLNPARDLSGTWQSSFTGTYYEMDPSDPSTRMDDVTCRFAMDITQQGSQIDIGLRFNSISWVTDNVYWQEFGFAGVPPVLDGIGFSGTVSGSSFSAVEQFTSFSPEHLVGTFTSDIITATLSGDSWTTDTNAIVVTRTGSASPNPTLSVTSSPTYTSSPSYTSTPATLPPTDPFDLGSVGLVRGSAWLKNIAGEMQLTSESQVGAGSQVRTGSDGIVGFSYPDQGGVVYLGGNTEVGWVGLVSHPSPDSSVTFTPLPSAVAHSFDWGEAALELGESTLAGAGLEMLLTGAVCPYVLGAEVAVHGGLILVHYGQFYVKENGWPQLFEVAQGFIQGRNTEYAVAVTNDSTVIQVIDGPVVFLDPVSNNSITLITGQMLTLPAVQLSGFSQQDLLSDTSAFDPASADQWWTQAASNTSSSSFFADQPIMLAGLIAVIAIVLAALATSVAKRRKKEFAQPEAINTSGIYSQKSISKTQLITQAIASLIVFVVIGYVLIILFSSQLGLDEELVSGVPSGVLFEILIVSMLSIVYVVALVQQVRSYRRQDLKLPPPLPNANGKIDASADKTATQTAPFHSRSKPILREEEQQS